MSGVLQKLQVGLNGYVVMGGGAGKWEMREGGAKGMFCYKDIMAFRLDEKRNTLFDYKLIKRYR